MCRDRHYSDCANRLYRTYKGREPAGSRATQQRLLLQASCCDSSVRDTHEFKQVPGRNGAYALNNCWEGDRHAPGNEARLLGGQAARRHRRIQSRQNGETGTDRVTKDTIRSREKVSSAANFIFTFSDAMG